MSFHAQAIIGMTKVSNLFHTFIFTGNHWDDDCVQFGNQPFHLPSLQLKISEGGRNHKKLLSTCEGWPSQHHKVDKKVKNGHKKQTTKRLKRLSASEGGLLSTTRLTKKTTDN